MHPEQGVTLERVEVAIELDVVVVAELTGTLAPGGLTLVDCFTFKLDLHWQEVAIGGDQGADSGRLDVFKLLFHQVQNHIGARLTALGRLQTEVGGAITAPAHRLRVPTGGEGHQFHLLGHHEAGIEPQAEMANDCVVFPLVFLKEIFRA